MSIPPTGIGTHFEPPQRTWPMAVLAWGGGGSLFTGQAVVKCVEARN